MAGPYRSNVVQNSVSRAASFDPPLDGLYVTAAPTSSVAITVSGVSVTFTAAMMPAGTLLEVGQISAVASNGSFTYIGLREKHNAVISDDLNVVGD